MLAKRTGFVAILLLVVSSAALAQTWNGAGANDSFTNGANWVGGAAPVNTGLANAIFAGTTRLTPQVDVAYSLNSLAFNNTAAGFTINGNQTPPGAGGLPNNSFNLQTFNAGLLLGVPQTFTASGAALNIGPLNNNGNLLTFNTINGIS